MPISSGNAEKERKINTMNNPQEIQEQYRQYRSSLYDEYPQAARFEQSKRRFAQILMLLCLAVHLSFLYQTGTTSGGVTGYDILRTVSAMGTEIIFLLAAMGPRRRMAPLLYLLALYRLAYPAGPFRDRFWTGTAGRRHHCLFPSVRTADPGRRHVADSAAQK